MKEKLVMDLPDIRKVDEDLNKELLEDYAGERTGWYQVGPQRYLMPSKYATDVDKYIGITTRPDDVWISTFPRSGTTLTQELVWMLMNDLNYEAAEKLNLFERSPFLELNLFFHPETKAKFLRENEGKAENLEKIKAMSTPVYDIIDDFRSPRVIKTHFPPSMLPADIANTNPKIIYIARNPKNVVISYYHLMKLWRTSDYLNSFDKFCNQFLESNVPWAPYWNHVMEGWQNRTKPNFLFLFYEDMVKDMKATIREVAHFLNRQLTSEEVNKLADHLDIRNFKNNPAVNFEDHRELGVLSKEEQSFIRTGKERGTGREITKSIEEKIDHWIEQHYKLTDLRFPTKS